MTSVLWKEDADDDDDVLVEEDELVTDEMELVVEVCENVDDWLELDDNVLEANDGEEDVEVVTAEVVIGFVAEVVLVKVAKYKPTPATNKMTTIITTTIALEIALRLFFSDMDLGCLNGSGIKV
jgi:hypothetical protein